jgi:putative hydrolase of the HAD superfamily
MSEITTIFFDLGGVLLTNGWDTNSRRAAASQFDLDWDDFTYRHDYVADAIETNRMTLEQYLDRVVFYRPRAFSRKDFRAFIFAQSQEQPDSVKITEQLASSGKYFLATLNNEILELNLYRIEHFGLRRYFPVFFSSCFLGLRKPDEAIYRADLWTTQRAAEECIFVDDREVNLECPRALGMHTIQFQDADQLRRELRENGVDAID